jgi:hypothetical protein
VAAALRVVAERRRRQRQLRKLAVSAALAAGVFGLMLAGWLVRTEHGTAQPAPTRGVLPGGAVAEVWVSDERGELVSSLGEGSSFGPANASASLRFPSGALADVSSQSSLELLSLQHAEVVFLKRGRVELDVPKLGPQRDFVVETPDVQVSVHGTQFSVEVEATSGASRTRVHVTHGLVSVLHAGRQLFLRAGQTWPPPVAVRDPAQLGPAAAPHPPLDVGDQVRSERPRVTGSASLARQNQRFARAMQLKKNGALRAALAEIDRLLQLYPASPLSQESYVERLRLLQRLGLARELRPCAASYLRQFPRGYAEAEVRAMLTNSL